MPVLGSEPRDVQIEFKKTRVTDKYKYYGKVWKLIVKKGRKLLCWY